MAQKALAEAARRRALAKAVVEAKERAAGSSEDSSGVHKRLRSKLTPVKGGTPSTKTPDAKHPKQTQATPKKLFEGALLADKTECSAHT